MHSLASIALGVYRHLKKKKQTSQERVRYQVPSHEAGMGRPTCLEMPSVISTCVLRQLTHMFAGFDWIFEPHMQQRIMGRSLPPDVEAIIDVIACE